jgi:DNA-binding response OmpR family regulator
MRTQRAPRRGRLLLVGARCGGRARLGRALARQGYQAVYVRDGAEALLRLRRGDFAAVLLADDLPGIVGQALLPGLRVAWPEVPVIFVRRPGEMERVAEALANGAHACLVAPVRASDLLRALNEVEKCAGGTSERREEAGEHRMEGRSHGVGGNGTVLRL